MPPRDARRADRRLGATAAWRARDRGAPVPARIRPVSILVDEPRLPLDLADFQDLRRQGLFSDDGRNPPPSWWAR